MFPCKVKWCCCYDLKNGTITLGVVGIIASSFFSILTSLQVLLAGNEVHPIEILAITAMVLYGIISYLLVYGTNEVNILCSFFLACFKSCLSFETLNLKLV